MAKVLNPTFTKYPGGVHYPPYPPGASPPFMSYAASQVIANAKSHRRVTPITLPAQRRPTTKVPGGGLVMPTKNPLVFVDYDYMKGDFDAPKTPNRRRLELITVPSEIEFSPTPEWAVIASIGRNNPFYHFTGSEDTLSFTIDWYSNQDNREDVIYNCRWLETKAKADAYKADPHRILLQWGKEDLLFQNILWIVQKASYKLSQFQRHRGMLPQQAYQEVILKRVTSLNLNMSEIYGAIPTNPNQ